MFNMALFKMEWKSNYKFLIIFAAILTMYTVFMISMFDPQMGNVLDELAKSMPEIMAMIGMSGTSTTLVQFISNYLYGFIMVVFPFLSSLVIIIRLLVRKVDNGSMTYLLSCGNTRTCVIFTQICVWITTLLVLLLYTIVLGYACSHFMFDGALDSIAYLRLNLGLFCLQVAFGGIVFLSSCIFKEVKSATLFGAGIPVLCILIQMLANMGGDLEKMKYLTLLTLFDSDKLIVGDGQGYLFALILFLLGMLCLFVSAQIFKKRSLAL